MQQKLEYINKGPAGYVVYKDGVNEFKMFFEFGGGSCVAIIYIPAIEKWTFETNIDIKYREEIINYIAEQCIKDQAPSCTYEVEQDRILLVKK